MGLMDFEDEDYVSQLDQLTVFIFTYKDSLFCHLSSELLAERDGVPASHGAQSISNVSRSSPLSPSLEDKIAVSGEFAVALTRPWRYDRVHLIVGLSG